MIIQIGLFVLGAPIYITFALFYILISFCFSWRSFLTVHYDYERNYGNLIHTTQKLKDNSITSLSFGHYNSTVWLECGWFYQRYHLVHRLIKALEQNKSITKIDLGPKIKPGLLCPLLRAIAKIPTLHSVSINIQTWLPHEELQELLTKPKSLSQFELIDTRVLKDGASPGYYRFFEYRQRFQHVHNLSTSIFFTYPEKEENLFQVLKPYLRQFDSLSIQNCGLTNNHIIDLCQYIKQNQIKLNELKLICAGNSQLGISKEAVTAACTTNQIRRLDLSHSFANEGVMDQMLDVLEQREETESLQELVLTRNYRIGLPSHTGRSLRQEPPPAPKLLTRLIRIFATRKGLDLSDCYMDQVELKIIFNTLIEMGDKCTLEKLHICDAIKVPPKELIKLIKNNSSLKEIILHESTYPPFDEDDNDEDEFDSEDSYYDATFFGYGFCDEPLDLQELANALRYNFTLEKLKLDWPSDNRQERAKCLYYLRLNSGGRQIIKTSHPSNRDWDDALNKASKCPNTMYHLLCESNIALQRTSLSR